MQVLTTVLKVSLTIEGLTISYQKSSALRLDSHTLELCPVNTCKALEAAGMIEGFELDNNHEPVILYSEASTAAGYNGEPWCHFIKSFRLSHRMAELLIEAKEEKKAFNRIYNRIDKLRSPYAA